MKKLFLVLLCAFVTPWQTFADVNVTNLPTAITFPTNTYVLMITGTPPRLVNVPFSSLSNALALASLSVTATNYVTPTNFATLHTRAGRVKFAANTSQYWITNSYALTSSAVLATVNSLLPGTNGVTAASLPGGVMCLQLGYTNSAGVTDVSWWVVN